MSARCTPQSPPGQPQYGQVLWLSLSSPYVTDAGVAHLKGLANLRQLYLFGTKVSDAGLEHLKGLTNLRRLDLYRTKVTDEGVKKLQQALPNCEIEY